jgi:hypothetical protein
MRKLLSVCVLLAMIGLALLGLAGCGEEFDTVKGTVTQRLDPNKAADDPANVGPAIAQAEVVVYSLKQFTDVTNIEVYKKDKIIDKTQTDASGAFSFSLSKGKYVIEVWINGLTVDSRQVEARGGRTISLSFSVAAAP